MKYPCGEHHHENSDGKKSGSNVFPPILSLFQQGINHKYLQSEKASCESIMTCLSAFDNTGGLQCRYIPYISISTERDSNAASSIETAMDYKGLELAASGELTEGQPGRLGEGRKRNAYPFL